MDFTPITKAGLSYVEAAEILGVSKVMVFKYLKKGVTPRRECEKRVRVALKVLERLVEQNKLPRPDLIKCSTAHSIRDARAQMVATIRVFVEKRTTN